MSVKTCDWKQHLHSIFIDKYRIYYAFENFANRLLQRPSFVLQMAKIWRKFVQNVAVVICDRMLSLPRTISCKQSSLMAGSWFLHKRLIILVVKIQRKKKNENKPLYLLLAFSMTVWHLVPQFHESVFLCN